MEDAITENIINIERMEDLIGLFGNFDENIIRVEKRYSVSITSHGGYIKITGETENVSLASRAVEGLLSLLSKGETITEQNLEFIPLSEFPGSFGESERFLTPPQNL